MCRTCFTAQSISLRIWLVVLVNVACFLSGCASMGKSKEMTERAVKVFHSQLDSERYSEIYAQADEDFKKASSQEEFEKLVRAVHQKLGTVQAEKETGFLVNVGSATYVTLTYDTAFVNGKAAEQFVWRLSDARAALYNYTISSTELISR